MRYIMHCIIPQFQGKVNLTQNLTNGILIFTYLLIKSKRIYDGFTPI